MTKDKCKCGRPLDLSTCMGCNKLSFDCTCEPLFTGKEILTELKEIQKQLENLRMKYKLKNPKTSENIFQNILFGIESLKEIEGDDQDDKK